MKNKSVGNSFQDCEAQQHYFKLGNLLSSLCSNFKQVTLARMDFNRPNSYKEAKQQGYSNNMKFTHCKTSSQCFFYSDYSVYLLMFFFFFLIPFGKNINEHDFRTKTSIHFSQILYNQYADIYSFRITRSIVFGTYPQASVPQSGKCCFCSSRQGCCLVHFQNILVENKEQI